MLTDKQTSWLANKGYNYHSYDEENKLLQLSRKIKSEQSIYHCFRYKNNNWSYVDSTLVNKGKLTPKFLKMKEIKEIAMIVDFLNGGIKNG